MTDISEVPVFVESSEISESVTTVNKKTRGKGHHYIADGTFELAEEGENFIRAQNSWSIQQKTTTEDGVKVYYRCKLGTLKVPCASSLYILYHAEKDKTSVFTSQEEHCNHDHKDNGRGLSDEQKAVITELFNSGVTKPNSILSALASKNIEIPAKSKLSNYLAVLRIKKYGPAKISALKLTEWCDSRKEVPEDVDKPFVVSSRILAESNDAEKQDLKIFLSTIRLLQLALQSNSVQIDATYKLTWQGYPVFIVGASDANRRFHPFGIAVCSAETGKDFEFVFRSLKTGIYKATGVEHTFSILLADGSDAITNGFEAVYGNDFIRLMCWFHVSKNVDTRLRTIEAIKRKQIKDDISFLQISISDDTFDIASKLFLLKWKAESLENDKIKDFLEYFTCEWLVKHRYWYEGAALGTPSTNNGIESTNAEIKKSHTFRERFPIGQFLTSLEIKLLVEWSTARDPNNINSILFCKSVSRDLKMWTAAYQWATSDAKVLSEKINSQSGKYYICSSRNKSQGLTQEEVNESNNKTSWENLDSYRKARYSFWTVHLNSSSWEDANCNCPPFLKLQSCKHTLGLPIRLQLVKAPDDAKNIQLGQKRKRGRPGKAKAALIIQ